MISCASSSHEAKMEIKPGDTRGFFFLVFLLALSVFEAACELQIVQT